MNEILTGELSRVETSLAEWRKVLDEARKMVEAGQAKMIEAQRQIDLHEGRLGGLSWVLENAPGNPVGDE